MSKKRKRKKGAIVVPSIPIDHLAPPDDVAGWVETVAYVTRDGERVVVNETHTSPDLVPEGGKIRKQLEGAGGGAASSKTVPSLVAYVENLVRRHPPGTTNDDLWNAAPDDSSGADVYRVSNKLFDDTTEGGGRSITRNTFDKYVTKARPRKKLKK